MDKKERISVIVLGDIGRSPRMQYHALSLAKEGFIVDLIGYSGSDLQPLISQHQSIRPRYLTSLPEIPGPTIVKYILKTVWQTLSLFLIMLVNARTKFVLCQNPPGVPTLLVCWVYCLVLRAKLVVDWHNYTHTIMALSTGSKHPLVHLSKWLEMKIGAMAHANMCVTQAMRQDLMKNYNIRATVLYDRPPDVFRPITLKEKHELMCRLAVQYPVFGCGGRESLNLRDDTIKPNTKSVFTELKGENLFLRNDRPGFLFSSTSWTPDEDFQILLDALEDYELHCCDGVKLPQLICIITGKGPLKNYYRSVIDSKKWNYVKFVTPWLTPEDYPLMVASADLGVCLHTSSSGLDLPMKVVDMFGVGLPVCAYEFSCLSELVKDGVNGHTFGDSKQLSSQLVAWFTGFPDNERQNELLQKFKMELSEYQKNRWQDNWEKNARKLFQCADS